MKLSIPALLQKIPATWRARLGVTVAAGVLFGMMADTAQLRSLEWLAEGMRFKWRAKLGNVPPSGDVVLASIDMESIHTFGRWPWKRSILGQTIDLLGRDKGRPAVLAWDILFTEESSSEPAEERLFVDPVSLKRYPMVLGAELDEAANGLLMVQSGRLKAVPPSAIPSLGAATGRLAALPDMKGGTLPLPQLQQATDFGFLNADADADGIVRKIPLVARVGGRVYPSLVLQTVMSYLGVDASRVEIIPGKAVIVRPAGAAEYRIPIDAGGNYRLNYRYELDSKTGGRGIPELSLARLHETLLLRVEFQENIPAPPLEGKIVIVGQTASGLTDIGPSVLAGKSAKVLVHINALENILRGDYLRQAPLWPVLPPVLLIGLVVAWVLDRNRVFYFVAVAAVMLVAVAVSAVLLVKAGLMLPLAVPLAAFLLQQTAVTLLKIREEQVQRDRIRRMFGSYVSPELVRRMVESRTEPQLGGHEDEITAFFSDIQGFSAFSEVLPPADLVLLLNEYLGAMTDILQDGGGALDKYIGDAVVAMFGGLVPLADHARRACEVTARMQLRQAELREKWKAQGDRWPKQVHDMR
ncbi:MAG TPA: adenylate/guanylate cyclase domain-containing protein, partial [Rariglobus sp.]